MPLRQIRRKYTFIIRPHRRGLGCLIPLILKPQTIVQLSFNGDASQRELVDLPVLPLLELKCSLSTGKTTPKLNIYPNDNPKVTVPAMQTNHAHGPSLGWGVLLLLQNTIGNYCMKNESDITFIVSMSVIKLWVSWKLTNVSSYRISESDKGL